MPKKLFDVASNIEKDEKYSHKISIPQYLPSSVKPRLDSLVDYTKYSNLISEINKSNVSEDEKKFLKLAASRHLVFRYNLIADYYAHATPEMQDLMEKSALVILDVNDAIANGYIKLSKDIQTIFENQNK